MMLTIQIGGKKVIVKLIVTNETQCRAPQARLMAIWPGQTTLYTSRETLLPGTCMLLYVCVCLCVDGFGWIYIFRKKKRAKLRIKLCFHFI